MKVTKRPKKVKVHQREVKSIRSEYCCPTCQSIFIGGVFENVTRFICDCGQELIVNKDK